MDKKRWMILIAGFILIEGLILISNKVFYKQMNEMEKISQTDRAIFEIHQDVVQPEVKAAPALAGLRNDPLAPMVKQPKAEKGPASAENSGKVYETGVKTGVLIQ